MENNPLNSISESLKEQNSTAKLTVKALRNLAKNKVTAASEGAAGGIGSFAEKIKNILKPSNLLHATAGMLDIPALTMLGGNLESLGNVFSGVKSEFKNEIEKLKSDDKDNISSTDSLDNSTTNLITTNQNLDKSTTELNSSISNFSESVNDLSKTISETTTTPAGEKHSEITLVKDNKEIKRDKQFLKYDKLFLKYDKKSLKQTDRELKTTSELTNSIQNTSNFVDRESSEQTDTVETNNATATVQSASSTAVISSESLDKISSIIRNDSSTATDKEDFRKEEYDNQILTATESQATSLEKMVSMLSGTGNKKEDSEGGGGFFGSAILGMLGKTKLGGKVTDILKMFKGKLLGSVTSLFGMISSGFTSILSVVGPAVTGLVSSIGGMLSTVGSSVMSAIAAAPAAILGGIAGVVWALVDGIKGMFKFGGISGFFGGLLGGLDKGVSGMFKGAGKWALIGAGIGSVVPVVGTLIGGALGALFGGIMGFFGGEKISKALKGFGSWISESISGIWDTLKNAISFAVAKVKFYLNPLNWGKDFEKSDEAKALRLKQEKEAKQKAEQIAAEKISSEKSTTTLKDSDSTTVEKLQQSDSTVNQSRLQQSLEKSDSTAKISNLSDVRRYTDNYSKQLTDSSTAKIKLQNTDKQSLLQTASDITKLNTEVKDNYSSARYVEKATSSKDESKITEKEFTASPLKSFIKEKQLKIVNYNIVPTVAGTSTPLTATANSSALNLQQSSSVNNLRTTDVSPVYKNKIQEQSLVSSKVSSVSETKSAPVSNNTAVVNNTIHQSDVTDDLAVHNDDPGLYRRF